MMGAIAGGSWENCCMVGEHMHIADLFLNNFMEIVHFLLKVLLVG
jgi:hypothetical protein